MGLRDGHNPQPQWPSDLKSARAVIEYVANQKENDCVPAIGLAGLLMAVCMVLNSGR
jgi:hypothetical protein